jgi:hypothetical protein
MPTRGAGIDCRRTERGVFEGESAHAVIETLRCSLEPENIAEASVSNIAFRLLASSAWLTEPSPSASSEDTTESASSVVPPLPLARLSISLFEIEPSSSLSIASNIVSSGLLPDAPDVELDEVALPIADTDASAEDDALAAPDESPETCCIIISSIIMSLPSPFPDPDDEDDEEEEDESSSGGGGGGGMNPPDVPVVDEPELVALDDVALDDVDELDELLVCKSFISDQRLDESDELTAEVDIPSS